MSIRLSMGLFSVLASGCIDDTTSLSTGRPPQPIPVAPPSGQGGAANPGPVEAGGAPQAGAPTGVAGGEGGSGEAGAPEPMQACVSLPEVCNGEDDDCDGTADEGCPEAVAWKTSQLRPALGDSTGGSEFSESCESDEVLVGLKVAVSAWVDQVSGICRKLVLKADPETTPYEYSLGFSESRELAPHPAETHSAIQDLLCDDHQAIVGVRISQQNYVVDGQVKHIVVPSIWILCAEPVLDLADHAANVSWQEPVLVGPVAGSFADGTAWFAIDQLSSPDLAVQLHGMSGAWIDRLGLGASAMAAHFH